MLTSKKGMSARQIWRYMGFGSLETAWYMGHRVRVALMEDIDKLGGIVEVDPGDRASTRHRHWEVDAREMLAPVTDVGRSHLRA